MLKRLDLKWNVERI